VAAASAAAMVVVVVVVVVVVRGGKLAFGAHPFSTFYAQHQVRPTPGVSVWGSTRVLGVSPKGSVGVACVC